MTDLILIYITCESVQQAQDIGDKLLKKRLVACINIIPIMESHYFWPAKSNVITDAKETILICKTLETKWQEVEKEVLKIHSYSNPCIMAIPVKYITPKYYNWLKSELVLDKQFSNKH